MVAGSYNYSYSREDYQHFLCLELPFVLNDLSLLRYAKYISADGDLYTATASDFSGSDPLIYKEPLRTGQFDSKHLNCEYN